MQIKRYNRYILEKSEDNLKELFDDNKYLWWLDKDKLKESTVELSNILKRDCSKYLNEVSRSGMLYRGGYKSDITHYNKIKTRKNRKPSSTPLGITTLLDKYFEIEFGFKPRTQGVFVTPDTYQASIYGEIFLFFPIGDYEYVYNNNIDDLYTYLEENFDLSEGIDESEIEYIVKNYNNTNIKHAFQSDVEISFICDEYYLVRTVYEPGLEKLLFGTNED